MLLSTASNMRARLRPILQQVLPTTVYKIPFDSKAVASKADLAPSSVLFKSYLR